MKRQRNSTVEVLMFIYLFIRLQTILIVMILCLLADQFRRILSNKIYSLIEIVFK